MLLLGFTICVEITHAFESLLYDLLRLSDLWPVNRLYKLYSFQIYQGALELIQPIFGHKF